MSDNTKFLLILIAIVLGIYYFCQYSKLLFWNLLLFIFLMICVYLIIKRIEKYNAKFMEKDHNKKLLMLKDKISSDLNNDRSNIMECLKHALNLDKRNKDTNYELSMNLEETAEYLQNKDEKVDAIFNKKFQEYFPYLTDKEFINSLNDKYNGYVQTVNRINLLGYCFAETIDRNQSTETQIECELFDSPDLNLDFQKTLNVAASIKYDLGQNLLAAQIGPILEQFRNDAGGIISGVNGEERVKNDLKIYDYLLTCLYDFRIKVDNDYVENDVIILCENGVFSVEIKNFGSSGSYDIKISSDGQWLKCHGGYEEPMKDVMLQVNRHVAIKHKLINRELKSKYGESFEPVDVIPLIVIANDNVKINNQTNNTIIRSSQIFSKITEHKKCLSNQVISDIVNILNEHKVPSKPYPYNDYYRMIEEKLDFILYDLSYGAKMCCLHRKYQEMLYENNLLDSKTYSQKYDINLGLENCTDEVKAKIIKFRELQE